MERNSLNFKILSKYENATKAEPKLITIGEVMSVTQASQINWAHILAVLTMRRDFNTSEFIIFDTSMQEYIRELQGLLKQTPRRCVKYLYI